MEYGWKSLCLVELRWKDICEKASAEELKDYKRYYLAFEECEKYYYVTYKKSGKPDKELYFDERSVLSITWAGKPFEKIIDGEKRWDIEIVRA